MNSIIHIHRATEEDVSTILHLINAIAIYEKLGHEVEATEEKIKETLFGNPIYAECLIASIDGNAIGFCVYFTTYSTFLSKAGIYIEDIFVMEEHRNKGYGKLLMKEVVKIAHARNYGRVEWSVLNWNEPSIKFYEALGAVPLNEWTKFRLDKTDIDRLVDEL